MTIPLLLLETHLAHATDAVRRRLANPAATAAVHGLAGLADALAQALRDLGTPGHTAPKQDDASAEAFVRVHRQALRLAAAMLALHRGAAATPAAEVAAAAQNLALAHGRPLPFTALLTTVHRLSCNPYGDSVDAPTGATAADAAAAAMALASVALAHRAGAP